MPVRIGSRSATPPSTGTTARRGPPALRRRRRRLRLLLPRPRRPGRRRDDRRVRAAGRRSAACERLVLLSGRGEPEAQRAEQELIGRRRRVDDRALQLVRAELQRGLPARRRAGRRGRAAGRATCPSRSSTSRTSPTSPSPRSPRTATPAQVYELTGPRALRFAEAVGGDRRRAPAARSASCRSRSRRHAPACSRHGVPRGRGRRSSPTCSPRCSTAATRSPQDGVQRALGRAPRDFGEYARTTAADGGVGMISPGQTLENPVTGERFTFTAHRGQHGRRAARLRLRAAPRRQGPDPARAPDPDRALRGASRAQVRFRLGLRTFVAGPGEVVEAPPGVATASPTRATARRGCASRSAPRCAMEEMFAEVVALAEAGRMTTRGLPRNLLDARPARPPLRPGGARAAAQRRRPAAPARPARRGLSVLAAVRAPCGECARRRLTC